MVRCDIHQKAGIEAILVAASGDATSKGLNDGMVGDTCRKAGFFSSQLRLHRHGLAGAMGQLSRQAPLGAEPTACWALRPGR